MVRSTVTATALLLIAATTGQAEVPVTLGGSPESMVRQNRVAKQSEVTFFRTPADVHAAVASGELVPVDGDENYALSRISFPYARPETRLFLERFSEQYRAACGEKLVVTSLTRPQTQQPANAHRLSVHPTGLAIDLRISQDAACRSYLETTLLAMEREGVLDITRERTPPHYHLAIFPEEYLAFIGEPPLDAPVAYLSEVDYDAAVAFPLRSNSRSSASLLPVDDAGVERARGGWLGRILSLPARLISRVLSA